MQDQTQDQNLTRADFWQTRERGSNDSEYQIYLSCANDGKGGDITRNGAPLKTYHINLEATVPSLGIWSE